MERYHTIDHLRATMILIVMFGHAMLPYITIPRAFNDAQEHVAFDVIAVFLYSFAMPVFFVTAGFSTALIYYRKGGRGLFNSRFYRIFLPLLVAYALLAPLTQGAYTFSKYASNAGSIQAGIDQLLRWEWVAWNRAYHLWFLVALLVYSGFATGLRSVVRRLGVTEHILSASRALLASRWRSLLLTCLVALGMVPAYIIYGFDANTWPMQIALFTFFVVGWMLYLHRDLLPVFGEHPWRPIAVVVFIMPLATWSTRTRLLMPEEADVLVGALAGLTNAALAAFMTFALLGIYQAYLNRASTVAGYVSDASYWIFLIHFPFVIAAGGLWSVTALPAVIKYLLTVAIVVPIVWSTYHFGVRATLLGKMLKGTKRAGN